MQLVYSNFKGLIHLPNNGIVWNVNDDI